MMVKRTYIKHSLSTAVAILAVGFPAAAQARIEAAPLEAPVATVHAQVSDSPFEWGDAGIGAAGALVLLGGGVAAYGATRRRRGHHAITG